MRNISTIKLTKEKRDDMVSAIKSYFSREREEEIGDLAAGLLLDFIVEKLASEFYNQGVIDSQKFMENCLEDLLSIKKLDA
jgi:uncharacterized protein (DUF2164 family)